MDVKYCRICGTTTGIAGICHFCEEKEKRDAYSDYLEKINAKKRCTCYHGYDVYCPTHGISGYRDLFFRE